MLPLVLVGFALLQLSSQQEVPGVLQERSQQAGVRSNFSSNEEICDGTRYFSTCDGCNLVKVCLGENMDWHYCQDMSLDKPYCNNGECSTTPEFIENCPYIFKYCIGSGYYPDPYSCDIYHFCEEKDTASSVYKCPKNYVFNPETNLCKRQLQESDCMKVECSPGVVFSAYGTSKRFFGYCKYSSGPFPYEKEIHRCPEGTEFTGKKCAFQCPAEGRFANTSNERGYYECYYSDDEELVAVSQMCPADKVYSAELSTCIQQVTTTPATTTGL